ncbi:hypothetical protein H5410_001296 [Solanum commersonii]|uniref:Uncharacterized protein n=1 Tax=Solanum commersonii TaxID=4109 RepID=A0A9J6AZ92_SOLCO|nr:hypothetical protein H5410_001296 [Solanum commersonii]
MAVLVTGKYEASSPIGEGAFGCRVEACWRIWTKVQEGALESLVCLEPYQECRKNASDFG